MALSPFSRPAVDSPDCCEDEWCCTAKRRNANGTDVREVLYPWHPWTGRQIHIHEVVQRAGCDVFRCSIAGSAADRLLEIPAWMFDRAVCGMVRVDGTPRVDIGALVALVKLLQAAQPVSTSFVSGAALGPHDSHLEGLHAAQAHDDSVRSVLQPSRFRDRADTALVDAARTDAADADAVDRAPASRPCRQRSSHGLQGEAR